eukprot:2475901-Prymnesium_polylepis.2
MAMLPAMGSDSGWGREHGHGLWCVHRVMAMRRDGMGEQRQVCDEHLRFSAGRRSQVRANKASHGATTSFILALLASLKWFVYTNVYLRHHAPLAAPT